MIHRLWLLLVVGGLGALSVFGSAQGAVSLSWSWEVLAAGPCASAGGTHLRCSVPEGSPASVSLSVVSTPAQTVHLAPVVAPPGWPPAPASSGWGRVDAVYAFTPPTGTAGRQVQISFRAWTDGVPPVDLQITVDIAASTSSCGIGMPASSTAGPSRLAWSADRPITWDDFWATPPPDRASDGAAAIAMVLVYDVTLRAVSEGAQWRARVEALTVTAAMERDRSWVLQDRRTPAGLNHEQRHFDLAEVYRRLLEAALRGLSSVGRTAVEAKQNLEASARDVFREISARHNQAQALYDRETDHGRDASRQAEWDGKIRAWLLDPRLPLP